MRIRSEGTFVVGVLIASVVVATMLAFQAISAARSRQAVSDAMLRQYAQLAAWEFSRAARRDIDATLTHTLADLRTPREPQQGSVRLRSPGRRRLLVRDRT